MKAENVALVGLDRMSGSLGMALRDANVGLTVVGYDQERRIRDRAKDMGAVDRADGSLPKLAATADILILNSSLADLEDVIRTVGAEIQPHALIVDFARLKGPGLEIADKHLKAGHYVGASPILTVSSLYDRAIGIDGSKPDLFRNSVFCIMPSTKASSQAVETSVNLGKILGATPFFIDAHEFDGLMQGVETMPGLLALAMLQAVTKSASWGDMLRFAGAPFALTAAASDNEDLTLLAMHDQASALVWLDSIIVELRNTRRMIAEGDSERFQLVQQELAEIRNRWLRAREENIWEEKGDTSDLQGMNIGSRMFGSALTGGRKKS